MVYFILNLVWFFFHFFSCWNLSGRTFYLVFSVGAAISRPLLTAFRFWLEFRKTIFDIFPTFSDLFTKKILRLVCFFLDEVCFFFLNLVWGRSIFEVSMCTSYDYVEVCGKRIRKCREITPFPRTRPHPGERATRPREDASPRPPLAESGISGNPVAGDTEGWCVGWAWHGRGADGGRVAQGRAGANRGILELAYFQRSTTYILFGHHHHDHYWAALIYKDDSSSRHNVGAWENFRGHSSTLYVAWKRACSTTCSGWPNCTWFHHHQDNKDAVDYELLLFSH